MGALHELLYSRSSRLLPLQYYSGGIMDVINCSRTKLSHAMVIIGYGSYNGQDYWLLKNRYIDMYTNLAIYLSRALYI